MRVENDRHPAKLTVDPALLPEWAMPHQPPALEGHIIEHPSNYDMKTQVYGVDDED